MAKFVKDKNTTSVFEPVEFELPDPEKFIDELDLEFAAKTSGRKGIPSVNSTKGGDSTELKISHFFSTKVGQATLKVTESSLKLQQTILNTSLDKEITELEHLEHLFREKANVENSHFQSEIEDAKKDFRLLDDDLASFKRDNKLKREAVYPVSHVFSIALLLFILILESGLNSYFFAQANDFGLVGGFLQATIISAINLIVGLLTGILFFRSLNHVNTVRNVLGWVGISVFASLTVGFNLFVAHYRSALTQEPDRAGYVAVESFLESPLGISEFDSWVLFLIGVVVVIVSTLKSYRLDDVYPGYGKLARRVIEARDRLRDLQEEWSETLKEHFDDVCERMDILYEVCERKARNLTGYHNTLIHQKAILDRYVISLTSAMHHCITFYRNQNRQYRSEPCPEYFSEEPNENLEHNFTIEEIVDRRDQILENVREVARKLPNIKNSVSRVYQEQANRTSESVIL